MTDLPSELRTLVKRYGTHVLDDADGLRATLDDFLDEGTNPGDVNLLVDAVRFGSLERLQTLLNQGAEPSAATADVADGLAQRRGGDADSAYWACAVLGYAADLLPADLVPGSWDRPSSVVPKQEAPPVRSSMPVADPHAAVTNAPRFDAAAAAASANGSPLPNPGPAPVVDDHTQAGSAPSAIPAPRQPTGPPPGGPRTAGPDKPRRRFSWPWVAAAAVIVLLAASVVYLVATRPSDSGNASTDQGNGIPLSALKSDVPFGHFGDKLSDVLGVCTNGTIPNGDKDWNCAFKPPNSAYNLELTEVNAQEANASGFPAFVEDPPAGTILTLQTGSTKQHAYYMQRDQTGTGDTVKLTLYDIDPDHPGQAIFSTTDSAKAPLTREKADELLQSIGAATDKFPLPTAFQNQNLNVFAKPFETKHSDVSCTREFTKFKGEFEHVACQDGGILVEFGTSASLSRPENRYIPPDAQQYTWGAPGSAAGTLAISKVGPKSTRLYWEQNGVSSSSYGVLTGKNESVLRQYFEGFQGKISG